MNDDDDEYKMDTVKGPISLRHGLYMTWGPARDGRMLAIASDGSPQRGHKDVTVLSLALAPTREDAENWFKQIQIDRPWETRH